MVAMVIHGQPLFCNGQFSENKFFYYEEISFHDIKFVH